MNWEAVGVPWSSEFDDPMPLPNGRHACMMKFTSDSPYADPEAAARKLTHIELVNGPFLFDLKGIVSPPRSINR
jgi:hypothetical protein